MEGVQTLGGHAAAASLVRWWRDAGVDVLVEDEPQTWLRTASPIRAETSGCHAPAETPLRSAVAPPGQSEKLPPTLPAFLDWLRATPEARSGPGRILPAGDPRAGLMILTDMPEPGDAEAGVLLAGEIGELFDRMLVAIGRTRETVWLAPFATARLLGRIAPAELARLTKIARHQIALVKPKRLLIMGEQANRALIGSDWQTRRGALQSLNLGAVSVEAVSTFHPRLLHERPAYKAQAWKDLQLLMKGL